MSAYIGLPVFLILYFSHRFLYRKDSWAIPSEFVDLRLDPAEVE